MVSCSVCSNYDSLEKATNAKINNEDQNKKLLKQNNKPLRLECSVQNYDWGIVGNHCQVSRLFSLNSGAAIDPEKPYAELWIGTHKSGPSFLDHGNGEFGGSLSLKAWILENPNVALGGRVVEKFGADLPFMLKVLSVKKALSIQAHPDRELAGILHKAQPNVYKDDNHKPEMALALTNFEALCGFISVKELKEVLRKVPEIVELMDGVDIEQILCVDEHNGEDEVRPFLRSLFSQLMLSSKDKIHEMILKMKRRLDLELQERKLTDKEQLVLRLESQYPGDVGVMAAFLLNHVRLCSGEALYLGANEPHAYISGECVECMANSDNVVRAGLTSKHLDVKTLLAMLKYKQGYPKILRGISVNPYTRRYLPPFDEFEVDVSILPQDASMVFPSIPGPSLLLFIKGRGAIASAFSKEEIVEEGQIIFVPAFTEISIRAESPGFRLYRAGVNSRFFEHF